MGDSTDKPDKRSDSRATTHLNRRRLLALVSSASVGFAGCTSGGGDGTPSDSSGGGGSTASGGKSTTSSGVSGTSGSSATDQGTGGTGETNGDRPSLTAAWTAAQTSDISMNPYSKQFDTDLSAYFFDQLAYNFATGTTKLAVVDEWEYNEDDQTQTLKLQDDWKWWNGDSVTANDFAIRKKITDIQNGEQSQYESINVPDDYTIELTYKESQSSAVLEKISMRDKVVHYRDIYKPWLEKYQDASGADAISQVSEDFTQFKLSIDDLKEKGAGNSPFKIAAVKPQTITLERFDDHPWASDIDIEKVDLTFCNQQSCDQLVTNDEVDYSGFGAFPKKLRGNSPDHLETLAEYGAKYMLGLKINMRKTDALKQRGVRRAMACAIDQGNIITNNAGSGLEVPVQTGMDPAMAKDYLGEDTYKKFYKYPTGKDYEKADEFLEPTDYSRKNGKVVDADGNRVNLKVISTASNGAKFNAADTVQAQLSQYGFGIEFTTLPSQQYQQWTYNRTDEYDLAVQSHYAGYTFTPLDYYTTDFIFGMRINTVTHDNWKQEVEDWLSEDRERSPFNEKPLTPKIPTEPGALEISGEGETINLYDLDMKMQTASQKELEGIVEKFARYWNYNLPDIDLMQVQQGAWGDTKEFSWPEKDAETWKRSQPVIYNTKRGKVGYN